MGNSHFLRYAAHNWAHHLHGLQTELMDQSLAFVQDEMKTSAWLDCLRCNKWLDIGLSTEDLPLDPAFLAVYFYLLELFTWLILSRVTNQRGETPLLRAVKVEPWQKCLDLPCLDSLDQKIWQGGVEPWFVRSLDTDQHNMIQVILDLNADIEAKDSSDMTAAFCAVGKNNGGILSLLLDRRADINA